MPINNEILDAIRNSVPSIEYEVNEEFTQFIRNTWLNVHHESNQITEVWSIPTPTQDKIIYKKFSEFYKERFPRGSSTAVSWGVHMHLHIDSNQKMANDLFSHLNLTKIRNDLFNIPIRCKFKLYKTKWYFFHRENNRQQFVLDWNYNNNKANFISYKTRWCSTDSCINSIEFRLNNHINYNIATYYKLIMINSITEEVKFKPLPREFKSMIKSWITVPLPPLEKKSYTLNELKSEAAYLEWASLNTFRSNFEKLLDLEKKYFPPIKRTLNKLINWLTSTHIHSDLNYKKLLDDAGIATD